MSYEECKKLFVYELNVCEPYVVKNSAGLDLEIIWDWKGHDL